MNLKELNELNNIKTVSLFSGAGKMDANDVRSQLIWNSQKESLKAGVVVDYVSSKLWKDGKD